MIISDRRSDYVFKQLASHGPLIGQSATGTSLGYIIIATKTREFSRGSRISHVCNYELLNK